MVFNWLTCARDRAFDAEASRAASRPRGIGLLTASSGRPRPRASDSSSPPVAHEAKFAALAAREAAKRAGGYECVLRDDCVILLERIKLVGADELSALIVSTLRIARRRQPCRGDRLEHRAACGATSR